MRRARATAEARMSAPSEEPLETVKDRVLRRLLTTLSFGVLVIGGLILIQGLIGNFLQPRAWLPFGLSLAIFPLKFFHSRLGHRRTALLLVVYLLVLPGFVQLYHGLTPGGALTHVSLLLIAGLFFGTRALLLVFAACLTLLFVGTYVSTHELLTPYNARLWDPRDPLVAMRYTVVLLLFGGGIAAAIVDLTHKLERDARSLRETLAREREERTRREAAQRALEQSQRFEALAQLAGGVAHDFNNNLMLIMNSAELIEAERGASERIRGHAEAILGTAEAAARTIRQLLTLGRKQPPNPEAIRVRDLMRNCEQSIARLLPANIRLQVECKTGEIEVFADAGRLHQALLNLAINARDAMPDGGRLTLAAERVSVRGLPAGAEAVPGDYVCIRCSDTGRGIEEATQSRIFEPFFTTKEQTQGSGLGLAVVRSTVEEAGGFIDVESRVGAGTTFRLYLAPRPMRRAEVPDASASGIDVR
jgi:signal transduction histidine kinase